MSFLLHTSGSVGDLGGQPPSPGLPGPRMMTDPARSVYLVRPERHWRRRSPSVGIQEGLVGDTPEAGFYDRLKGLANRGWFGDWLAG